MAKRSEVTRRPTSTVATAKAPSVPRTAATADGWISQRAVREGIESLAIALVLAFLFRSFAAEAFVIPTGSMAPTLMGQHKDLLCKKCNYRYRVGASSESEDLARQRGNLDLVEDVVEVTCPQCRYMMSVDPRTAAGREFPTYGGDRILASKFPYEFTEPNRWDVLIFKFPGKAQDNYIKRLVGLPNETVKIDRGDLFFKTADEAKYRRDLRPPEKLRAMAQMVYDNDYVVDSMTERGWPLRWQSLPTNPQDGGGWVSPDGGRSFDIDGADPNLRWLRYQHFVPSLHDWDFMKNGRFTAENQPRPRLITDFYAYNTGLSRGAPLAQPILLGLHWVGDLMLDCRVEVTKAEGNLRFDLVKGGRHFTCEIDVVLGNAQLSIDGVKDFAPKAQTPVRGTGRHRIVFANFDEQLLLWVDGGLIEFDASTSYASLDNDRPRSTSDDPGDLAPVGVAAQGCAAKLSEIRLLRDVYYIANDGRQRQYAIADYTFAMTYDQLLEFWSTPRLWEGKGPNNPFDGRREAFFPLAADQYFMLGDNSPMSLDARLWDDEKFVKREFLVGKALMIFWPHSFDTLPGTSIPFPFFPNFARMGFIR